MSKSILVIACIGVAGCLVLSSTMKWLVEHEQSQRSTPWLPAVESRFAGRLVGSLAMHEEQDGAVTRIVVAGRAAGGEDRRDLAAAVASEVWQRVGASTSATEVEVTLRDANGQVPVSQIAARPTPAR